MLIVIRYFLSRAKSRLGLIIRDPIVWAFGGIFIPLNLFLTVFTADDADI